MTSINKSTNNKKKNPDRDDIHRTEQEKQNKNKAKQLINKFDAIFKGAYCSLQGFGTYTALTGLPLTPDITFSSLALFNRLSMPLMMLPMSLLYFINGIVSTKRIQKFLAAPEVEDDSVTDHTNGVTSETERVRALLKV